MNACSASHSSGPVCQIVPSCLQCLSLSGLFTRTFRVWPWASSLLANDAAVEICSKLYLVHQTTLCWYQSPPTESTLLQQYPCQCG